jgi:rod shape-determining protein MreD
MVERIDGMGRAVTPAVLVLLSIMLMATPIRVPATIAVTPLLPAIAIHHFSLYEADRLPGWAVLLLGLFMDLLTGGPLGIWAAVFVAMRYLVDSNGRYLAGHGFAIGWLGFVLTCGLTLAAVWMLMSLLVMQIIDPRPALLQLVVTAALYPPLSWLLGKLSSWRGVAT